jgi:hypothetical protein
MSERRKKISRCDTLAAGGKLNQRQAATHIFET